jgi:hypothetical protein
MKEGTCCSRSQCLLRYLKGRVGLGVHITRSNNPDITAMLTYTQFMLARLMLPYGRLVSVVTTAVVSLLLLIVPVYSSGRTLLEVNGPLVLGILAIPIVIALGPLVFPRLKIPAAIAMLVFALIGGFSIGFFYLPAATLLAWPERR